MKTYFIYREFFYIQMEKYARQALQEGVKDEQELLVNEDHELYRVLNVHYNRNNHIEVSFKINLLTVFVEYSDQSQSSLYRIYIIIIELQTLTVAYSLLKLWYICIWRKQ